jgi:DNA-binding MarR family transcriptional regulator|tara:strand:+ start:4390 stop:4956 length:567 start_codon:yes stop_codon:yes gene_type:complete
LSSHFAERKTVADGEHQTGRKEPNAIRAQATQPEGGDKARRRKVRRPLQRGVLAELVGYHLRRTQLVVFQKFAEQVGSTQVTPGQFGVLALIQANPGLNQSELGDAMGIDRSTVVAVIDRLETRGIVERQPSPHDRRSNALRLSAAGEALFAEVRELVKAHDRDIASDLSAGERAQLMALLSRIADAE